MNKNAINLINHSTSTFSSIAQMTQYRMMYMQDRDAEAKEKCINMPSWLEQGLRIF